MGFGMAEIIARLGLDDTAFGRGLTAAEKRVGGFKKMMGGIGIGLGGAAVLGYFRGVTQELIKIDDVAKKLGVSSDLLQELQFGAESKNVKLEAFNMGLQRYVRRLDEARRGTGEAKTMFKALDIPIHNVDGSLRGVDEILYDLADRLAAMETGGERVGATFKFVDSEGVDMVRMLQEGSDEMRKMSAEAHRLGIVIDKDTIARIQEVNQKLTVLRKQRTGFGAAIMGGVFDASEVIGSVAGKLGASGEKQAAWWNLMGRYGNYMVRTYGTLEERVDAVTKKAEEQAAAQKHFIDVAEEEKKAKALAAAEEALAATVKKGNFDRLSAEEKIVAKYKESFELRIEAEKIQDRTIEKLGLLKKSQEAANQAARMERTEAEKQAKREADIAEKMVDLREQFADFYAEDLSIAKQIERVEKKIADLRKVANDEAAKPDARVKAVNELLSRERELKGLRESQVSRNALQQEHLASSFDEVLRGERGSSADQRRAKRSERLMSDARRKFDTGSRLLESGDAGDRARGAGLISAAEGSLGRSQRLRQGIAGLSDEAKNPFKRLEDESEKQTKHLESIDTKLAVAEGGSE